MRVGNAFWICLLMTLFSFDLRIGGSEIEEEEEEVDSESDELTYFRFLCFLVGFGESIFGGGSGFLSVDTSLFANFCFRAAIHFSNAARFAGV